MRPADVVCLRLGLILMDVGLPDGDGLDISHTIRKDSKCPNQNWSFDKRVRTPILLSNVYKNANKGLC